MRSPSLRKGYRSDDKPTACDEAEAFAYELLMPEVMVKKIVLKYREYGLDVDSLAKIFGVEKNRVIMRLQELGIKLYV